MKIYAWMLAILFVAETPLTGEVMFVNEPAAVQVQEGRLVTLESEAIGAAPVRYQWFREGAIIEGANAPTLVLKNIRLKDAGLYRVVARDQTRATADATVVVDVEAVPIVQGGVDLSFDPEVSTDKNPLRVSMAILEDGKVLFAGVGVDWVHRFLSDGRADPSFRPVKAEGFLTVDASGRLLVAMREQLVRLLPDGKLDPEFQIFSPSRAMLTAPVLSLPGGKVMLFFRGRELTLSQLNEDGTLDESFQFEEPVLQIAAMAEAGGEALLAVEHPDHRFKVTVLTLEESGKVADRFVTDIGTAAVKHLSVTPAGHILIAGGFALHLLDRTGQVLENATSPVGGISDAAVDSSGRIVVSGTGGVARLNADLSLDVTLLPEAVQGILPQPDGKVLVSGPFQSLQGIPRNRLARIHGEGEPAAASISIPPVGRSVPVRRDVVLNVAASGNPYPRFQWYHGDVPIEGATTPSLDLLKVSREQAGLYHVKVENEHGTAESEPVMLEVLPELETSGEVDIDFRFRPDFSGGSWVGASLTQPDGRILLSGAFDTVNQLPYYRLVRLNPDGSVDGRFDAGLGPNSGAWIDALALQDDGKVLAGGSFTTFNGYTRSKLVRLWPDGTVDTSFEGPDFDGAIFSIAVAPDQTILVAGTMTRAGRMRGRGIFRLAQDGELIRGFGPEVAADSFIGLPNGKLFAFGPEVALLDPSGAVSAGYSIPALAVAAGFGVFPDGGALVAKAGGSGMVEVLADGQMGSLFQLPGTLSAGAVLPNGKVLASRYLEAAIIQFQQNGELDATFEPDFALMMRGAEGLEVQKDGDVLMLALAGIREFPSLPGSVLERLDVYPFVRFRGGPAEVPTILEQPVAVDATAGQRVVLEAKVAAYPEADYQWFLNGEPVSGATKRAMIFSRVGEQEAGDYFLRASNRAGSVESERVRLTVTAPVHRVGAVDLAFGKELPRYSRFSKVIASGKGFVAAAEVGDRLQLVRLDETGSVAAVLGTPSEGGRQSDLDSGYDQAQFFDVAQDPDGRIVVAGDFRKWNGEAAFYVVRLLADGTVDPAFAPGAGPAREEDPTRPPFPPLIHAVAVQGDGKLILGGQFNMFAGEKTGNLVRLNQDGSLDRSFALNPESFGSFSDFRMIHEIAIQGERIWIRGDFQAMAGLPRPGLAAFDSAGAFQESFVPAVPEGARIHSLAPAGGHSIVVAGADAAGLGYLAKLDEAGNPVPGFASGTIADEAIDKVIVIGNGDIVIGGRFSLVHDQPRSVVAKLTSTGELDEGFDAGHPRFTRASGIALSSLVWSEDRVIVGGSFMEIDGYPQSGLAALSLEQSGAILRIAAISVDGGNVVIQMGEGNPPGLLVLEATENLGTGQWSGIEAERPVPGTLVDVQPDAGHRFYRVRLEE